jgi:hypothetical protein
MNDGPNDHWRIIDLNAGDHLSSILSKAVSMVEKQPLPVIATYGARIFDDMASFPSWRFIQSGEKYYDTSDYGAVFAERGYYRPAAEPPHVLHGGTDDPSLAPVKLSLDFMVQADLRGVAEKAFGRPLGPVSTGIAIVPGSKWLIISDSMGDDDAFFFIRNDGSIIRAGTLYRLDQFAGSPRPLRWDSIDPNAPREVQDAARSLPHIDDEW